MSSTSQGADRGRLLRRALHLEIFTFSWNALEALASLAAGVLAGSIALVGFGLDSVIETIAAIYVFRRLRTELGAGVAPAERAETRALRVIGATFLALGAYILYEGAHALLTHERPSESALGIAVAALSLVVMPVLAWRKRTVGLALGSAAVVADATETLVCAYLSLTLLLGLGLNALVGWWWTDPVAGLLMVPFVVNEGVEALRGEEEA